MASPLFLFFILLYCLSLLDICLSTFLKQELMRAIFLAEIIYMLWIEIVTLLGFIKEGGFSSVSFLFYYFVEDFIEGSRTEMLLICHPL